MAWLEAVVGLVILTAGRQLFWLFVAAVGFVYGMELAPALFPAQPPAIVWLIALATGLLGALLAYALQWAAVAAAGFLAGGRLALLVAASLLPDATGITWIAFLVGGTIGLLMVLLLFDWALIALSSIAGAMLVAEAIGVGPAVRLLVVAGLAAVGMVVQGAWFRPAAAGDPA